MEPDLIAIVIVEKSKLVNGKLTLVFDRHSYELKQWIVTDAQGLNTSVAVYNVTTGKNSRPGTLQDQLLPVAVTGPSGRLPSIFAGRAASATGPLKSRKPRPISFAARIVPFR